MAEWLCCSKKGAYLIISAVVWGSIPHVIFCFKTSKSPKSQSPQGVPTESPRSPWGTVRGLLGESPICGDYIGSPSGLLGDSLETPWGLLGDSLGTGRTSAKLGLIPKESLGDSSGTPQGLPGLPGDSLGLLGDSLGTPQQRVAQCNDLSPCTVELAWHWLNIQSVYCRISLTPTEYWLSVLIG